MHASRRIKWTLHDSDVLAAWVAEMDYPLPSAIREALIDQIHSEGLGYPPLPIDPRLRAAFVERQASRYDWQVEPRRVFALVNVLQGLDSAILLHSDPGDGVVLLTPIYQPFHRAVDRTGRQRVESEMVPRTVGGEQGVVRYEIDFDHLAHQLEVNQNPRILLLCHPHNPTGRVFTRSELESLAELTLRHRLVVVSDEIHADLTLDERRHIPFAALSPEIAARTITLSSATKSFNLAGLPMAIAVFGSDELKKKHLSLPPHLIGHGGPLAIVAAITAWTHPDCETWLRSLKSYLERNRDHLVEHLTTAVPELSITRPEATYLAWVDASGLHLEEDCSSILFERGRVAASHGTEFWAAGSPDVAKGPSHLRLNFATSRGILSDIARRCVETFRSIS